MDSAGGVTAWEKLTVVRRTQTISLMAEGKLDVSSLTSGVRPLGEAVAAIDEMHGGGGIIKYLVATVVEGYFLLKNSGLRRQG